MVEVNLHNLILEFDQRNEKYPMYKWTRMCMRQMTNLQLYLRSIRQRNLGENLAALEELCIWIFAYNRFDYAMHLPEFIARMYELKHTYPKIWEDFQKGEFTAKTNQTEALLRYCLSTPELSRLSVETEKYSY